MRRLALLLLAACAPLLGAGPAIADTVGAVLAANRDASGGDALEHAGTIELDYDFSGQGLTGKSRWTYDLATGAYVERLDYGPASEIDGFDGGPAAWTADETGWVTPEAGGDMRQLAVNEAYRLANLWWRRGRGGARIESLPRAASGAARFDVLRVTPVGGKPFEAWFDASTHLLARTVEPQNFETETTFFTEYRSVDGVELPGRVVSDDGTGVRYRQALTLVGARLAPPRPLGAYAAPTSAPTPARILNAEGRTTVPFQLLNNHIYLQAKVNGKGPFLFILDTGGHDLLTPETAKALAATVEGDAPGVGAGEGVVDSGLARDVTIQVGDLVFPRQTVEVVPIGAPAIEGFDEQGMIGFQLLRAFVTEVDYGARTVTFIDPARFDPAAAGQPLPFDFYVQLPQVKGSFEGLPGLFDIDTGSRDELTLTKPFVERAGLMARHPAGVLAVDGWGVGGPTRSYVTRGSDLVLGRVKVRRLVVGFATGSKGAFADPSFEGNVGSGLLKRFVVTFDYPRQLIYLRPARPPPADVDVFDRAGFWINGGADGFSIVDLTAGGPAAAAGLARGDTITAVDGVPAARIALSDLRRRLRDDPPGTRVRLEVVSGGAARSVELMLKDQI